MAMKFSSVTNLVLLSATTLLLVHASARTLQQTQTLPLLGGVAAPTKSESPTTVDAPLDDQKNFIYGAGIGGAAGVGGFFGMPGGGTGMTLPSGTPLLGGAGGAFGGLGGAMGFPGGLGGGSSGGGVPSSSGGSP
ncbi:PREDICTED: glycine-rich cell wall structural protein 1-like [Camelina sativa]|uniref:Glycine-rich cell wall structural protein 1-like n=1 Tax=Camelina sativa TaxID=90675 RepID=A0ABM0ZB37_CAMSA|nr:PREDICTED: glycine-rich cell wall structural protein 1-like [Camelina sativa]